MANVSKYHPPGAGTAESADPLFVAKVRPCGRCGGRTRAVESGE